jgi:transcriptional antiterminator NusG
MAMTDAAWNVVQSVPNVVHFVSSGAAPLPIKNKEAKVILRLAGLETVEKADKKAATVDIEYEVGEVVKIKSGAFADFVGTVSEIHPEKHELKVMVNIFGRETPVVVHLSEVEQV